MTKDSDAEHLGALKHPGRLGTRADPAFDRLARLAAKVLNTPAAMISLVDGDRHILGCGIGLPEAWAGARETSLPHPLCRHVVGASAPLLVEDGRDHPLVPGDLAVPSYLGVPLQASGQALGALGVIGESPRAWSPDEVSTLEGLAACVVTEVALRAHVAERAGTAGRCPGTDPDGVEGGPQRLAPDRAEPGARDIDALTHALASEERFRAFVTASSDAIYRMSADWSEMYHLEGRAFIADTTEPNRTWLEKYIHPDDQPGVLDAIADAIRTKGAFELEHRVLRVDGSLGWTFSRAVPILDDDGHIVEWFGTASDVTPRKEAEAENERIQAESDRQKRIYEAALSNTPDLVYVWDLDHRFIYANEALLRMWGKTREDALGKHCIELGYEPWHAEMHDREIDRVTARKEPFRGEVPFTGTNGRRIYDYILVPVVGPSGEVEAVAGTTRDVTDRKAVEQATEAARAEAEHANRMKDEFLATLSHELRTPLNAIVGWAKILRSGKADEEDLKEGLEVIERNGLAQASLIEDLLDVSRITSGNLRLDLQRLNIADVIEAALGAVAPAASAKEIRLVKTLDSLVGPVTGDFARLQQVVWNLLTNAVKFTSKGGKVQVLLERVNSHIEISVIDTGMGISPEFLPYVFDRFRQADSTTTRRHGGLGLGLSIVKNLVEMHGGSIRAKSPGEGLGATFTVMLPITVVHPDRTAPPRSTRLEDTTPPESHRNKVLAGLKVLVVDDEPDARQMVRHVLVGCDAEVAVAGSAAEALETLKHFAADVLVSDVGMPEEDGYDLMRKVRETTSAKELPAVALTAFARTEDRKRAMLAGFQSHIAKPVDPAELSAVVASLAGRTGRSNEPSGTLG